MSVLVAQQGLLGAPVVQVSAMTLRGGGGSSAPRVRVAQMTLGPGSAPSPPARMQVASMLLYAGHAGPIPGQSLLAQWDGDRWVRMPVVTWNGTAWVGAT